jgi:hypothetical protein
MRICREVLAGKPRFFRQEDRTASHQMIGPDGRGRMWTVAIRYLGEGRAAPITAWPAKRQQIRRYEEAQ